jgi:Bax protein
MNINYKKPIMAKQPEFTFTNSEQFISALESCINWIEKDTTKYQNIPREITIAQAVIESDYGRSRFAKQGNNLFGVRTWDLDQPHIKPFNDNTSIFGLKVYKNKCDSVKDYIRILNTGSAFEEFRQLRFKMLKENNINPLLLVEKLKRFATDPDYIKIIKRTIIKLRK